MCGNVGVRTGAPVPVTCDIDENVEGTGAWEDTVALSHNPI